MVDLDTEDTEEYEQWLALLKEIQAIHQTLQAEPNSKGLKMARSLAYNILADIHALIDKTEGDQASSNDDDPLRGLDLN